MRIYTRHGDDGRTALRAGARLSKDDGRIALLGDLDESQAALGVARAECEPGSAEDSQLLELERDLWLVMADVALPRERLVAEGKVEAAMVARLEARIDELRGALALSPNFSVPGANRRSAALDLARAVVRRAERSAVAAGVDGTLLAYLNRLSDLCWALARHAEGGGEHRVHRSRPAAAANDGQQEER